MPLRAVEMASDQVKPPSSDFVMAMLEIAAVSSKLPTVKSSRPMEIDTMWTLPSESNATTGSPAPIRSLRMNGVWMGPSQVSPPSKVV